jgi:hypothetical protein
MIADAEEVLTAVPVRVMGGTLAITHRIIAIIRGIPGVLGMIMGPALLMTVVRIALPRIPVIQTAPHRIPLDHQVQMGDLRKMASSGG